MRSAPRPALLAQVGVALALAGCTFVDHGPENFVQDCAEAIAAADHTLVERYNDRKSIGVAFTGPISADPIADISAGSGELSLSPEREVPVGPYLLIARGTLTLGNDKCFVHVQKLKPDLAPPEYLAVTDASASSIQRGEAELIVIMVGPSSQ